MTLARSFLTLLLLTLMLPASGCGHATTQTGTTPSPARASASSEPPGAQASATAVPKGMKLFKDTVHGYTLMFPQDVSLVTNEKTIHLIMQGGVSQIGSKNADLAETVRKNGYIFFLLDLRHRVNKFTPNLGLVVEDIPATADVTNVDQYTALAKQQLARAPQFGNISEPSPVEIGGKDCRKIDVTLSLSGRRIPETMYICYHAAAKQALIFGVTGDDPRLDAVVKSIQFSF